MLYIIGLTFSLSAFWLLMSGHYTPLILFLGAISVGFVLYLTKRMDALDEDTFEFKLKRRHFSYWSWLAKEIFKANLDVAKVVLAPNMKLSPRMLRVPTSQSSELGTVIYANSITLTPGTVSVDIEGDEIIVHALTQELMDGLTEGDMDKRVNYLEEL
ncbi:MAG: Na+/H+ antiporter subunit E [Pseudomonadota bacterium]|jgi:multicomponent Na+:H+ antiporter subunit E|nr:Na+/H+ antiporter subunit E [Nisaea sp.]MEC7973515.1 Na+/H+ antiporter subunit E [Pseudomonadota bacterium]MEC9044577.1 Na+/H+ antiporter subunit E [Pseudomonadota bacterium]MED5226206.1 Na+/H+ antiporter subunit E [Pseudomonadota bacterium]MED5472925.1 Na+/H+ antiporter subunit E [Pseudomonadota bacterium]